MLKFVKHLRWLQSLSNPVLDGFRKLRDTNSYNWRRHSQVQYSVLTFCMEL